MDLQLLGKRALVTGSSSGIGTGVAKALAAEGACVVVHGRDSDRAESVAAQIRASGGQAMIALGDIETDEGAEVVANAALAAFGGIDILINNAGGTQNAVVGWFGMPMADWLGTYNKNIGTTVRMIHRFCEPMRARGWGRIINLGSYAGQSHAGQGPAYAASKAAIANLTLGLSKSLAFTGITVNTISPGLIDTPMLDKFIDRTGKAQGMDGDREKTVQHIVQNMLKQSVTRLGTPQDIGAMATFLCSPLADFVTGANIRVDGGAAPSVT
jgi:3-oxoacyl-[acyl-carrier protein] reductase